MSFNLNAPNITTFVLGVIAGAALKVIIDPSVRIFKKKKADNNNNNNTQKEDFVKIPMPNYSYTHGMKIVVGVRTDMKLNLPETANLLGDIVIKSVVNSIKANPEPVSRWLGSGQAKICTKVQSREMMDDLIEKAKSCGVHYETIEYKGDIAAFAAGPAKIEDVDPVTKHLKLLG